MRSPTSSTRHSPDRLTSSPTPKRSTPFPFSTRCLNRRELVYPPRSGETDTKRLALGAYGDVQPCRDRRGLLLHESRTRALSEVPVTKPRRKRPECPLWHTGQPLPDRPPARYRPCR